MPFAPLPSHDVRFSSTRDTGGGKSHQSATAFRGAGRGRVLTGVDMFSFIAALFTVLNSDSDELSGRVQGLSVSLGH